MSFGFFGGPRGARASLRIFDDTDAILAQSRTTFGDIIITATCGTPQESFSILRKIFLADRALNAVVCSFHTDHHQRPLKVTV